MDSTTLFLATLIIVTLLVLVLVVYLILIIVALRRAGTHLEGLAGGLQKIQDDTGPFGRKSGCHQWCACGNFTGDYPRWILI